MSVGMRVVRCADVMITVLLSTPISTRTNHAVPKTHNMVTFGGVANLRRRTANLRVVLNLKQLRPATPRESGLGSRVCLGSTYCGILHPSCNLPLGFKKLDPSKSTARARLPSSSASEQRGLSFTLRFFECRWSPGINPSCQRHGQRP